MSAEKKTPIILLYMSSDLSHVMLLVFVSSVLPHSYTQQGAHAVSGHGGSPAIMARRETHSLRGPGSSLAGGCTSCKQVREKGEGEKRK